MISICITSYNRSETTIRAFEQVLNDERVSEIVINDDFSNLVIFRELTYLVKELQNDKIKLYRNEVNQDCYFNKARTIHLAKNDWCILLDSDNVIDKNYIDTLFKYHPNADWPKNLIFQPEFARPHFNFHHLSGKVLDASNINSYLSEGNTETMLNAMNYFVHKETYLLAFDDSIDPVTSDSLYQNYNLLKNGNSIFVVPGLEYEHPISEDSHYKLNNKRTPKGFHEEILQKLRELK